MGRDLRSPSNCRGRTIFFLTGDGDAESLDSSIRYDMLIAYMLLVERHMVFEHNAVQPKG